MTANAVECHPTLTELDQARSTFGTHETRDVFYRAATDLVDFAGQPGWLRQRGLARKRSLALREYALCLEALDRVARGEPLWRVHECVVAVLALESEPVDLRL